MDEEVEREKNDREWEAKREEARRKDEEKTEKNRRKREKKKAAASKRNGNRDQNQNHGDNVDKTDENNKKGAGGGNGMAGRERRDEKMDVDGHPDGGSSRPGAENNPESRDGNADEQAAPVDEAQGVIIHDDD